MQKQILTLYFTLYRIRNIEKEAARPLFRQLMIR